MAAQVPQDVKQLLMGGHSTQFNLATVRLRSTACMGIMWASRCNDRSARRCMHADLRRDASPHAWGGAWRCRGEHEGACGCMEAHGGRLTARRGAWKSMGEHGGACTVYTSACGCMEKHGGTRRMYSAHGGA
eukprot:366507-Chlamydomonas_euryale.AAC.4